VLRTFEIDEVEFSPGYEDTRALEATEPQDRAVAKKAQVGKGGRVVQVISILVFCHEENASTLVT
jgi:hypothetical protein